MPKLCEHVTALTVDTFNDFFPAFDLFLGVESRCTQPSAARDRNVGCLAVATTNGARIGLALSDYRPCKPIVWICLGIVDEFAQGKLSTMSIRQYGLRRSMNS